MNKIQKKAIFWDNDGVLVDTEKYYFEATRRILENIGFELTKEMYIELVLIQAIGPWHLLDQKKFSEEYIGSLKEERNKLYHEFLLTKEILIEGVEEILAKLSEKYKMAIVTSSRPNHFEAIHSRTGLLKYFSFVINPNDYSLYKPNPEPYLKAIERMGIIPSEGIVIEDSQRGLIAAKAAGLECIIIQNELTKNCDFTKADYLLSDIKEVTRML